MKILITGGASGLGKSITQLLAKEENTVYFTYSKSESAAKTLENEFSNTQAINCDFADEASVKSLVEKIAELNLDVIIHNAYSGDYLKTHFHKIAADDFLNDFKINVMPVIELTQAAISNFRKQKSGKIITILSSALLELPVGSAVYTANKAYLQKLTEIWAKENEKFNITSNSVSPTFMETEMTTSIDDRIKEQIIENSPLKRLITTEEVARTVHFLAMKNKAFSGMDFVLKPGDVLI